MALNVNYTEDEMEKIFLPEVWGPNYWFFLMTLAMTYPDHVNPVIKRKYYDFITNLPIFIPNYKMGNRFSEMLDKYPVSPYLDCRDSFIRWVVFIHNKINVLLGKPALTREEAIRQYFNKMVPLELHDRKMAKTRRYIIYSLLMAGLIGVIYLAVR